MNALQEGQGNNPYVNVVDDNAKDDPYSEVQIPHIKDNTFQGGNRNMFASTGIAGRKKDPPLQLIGEDGTTYADLMIFNQLPVDPDKIHGIENLVQYASIDFTKLKKDT
ncbi:hypothetical protein LSH36_2481g00001 [Paralvinella palmiformis]|uniref:Uncharacterized protein n=1 Tax=Paralvinella palmiformis TaxID=53620 RepID=A0AAD9IR72_9ANNE|nr:hypothetical protein LSH36_2481g00001 [Paralvinella palmiformis]